MNSPLFFVLDEQKNPVPCDAVRFSAFISDIDKRRVAEDTVGPYYVSTVFLGTDHNFTGSGPAILFETMVFKPPPPGLGLAQDRYSTWDEAVAGHAAMVARVMSATAKGIPFLGDG